MNINYLNHNIPTGMIKIIFVKAKRFLLITNFGIALNIDNYKILNR